MKGAPALLSNIRLGWKGLPGTNTLAYKNICKLCTKKFYYRETWRQRDRETGRQGDRETGRQGDRETERQRDREIGRQGDSETQTQNDKVAERKRDQET